MNVQDYINLLQGVGIGSKYGNNDHYLVANPTKVSAPKSLNSLRQYYAEQSGTPSNLVYVKNQQEHPEKKKKMEIVKFQQKTFESILFNKK